jgi:hypothetical protein
MLTLHEQNLLPVSVLAKALRQRFGSTVEEGHALQPTLPNEGSRRTSTMRVQLGTYDQSNHSLFCLISCCSDSA